MYSLQDDSVEEQANTFLSASGEIFKWLMEQFLKPDIPQIFLVTGT